MIGTVISILTIISLYFWIAGAIGRRQERRAAKKAAKQAAKEKAERDNFFSKQREILGLSSNFYRPHVTNPELKFEKLLRWVPGENGVFLEYWPVADDLDFKIIVLNTSKRFIEKGNRIGVSFTHTIFGSLPEILAPETGVVTCLVDRNLFRGPYSEADLKKGNRPIYLDTDSEHISAFLEEGRSRILQRPEATKLKSEEVPTVPTAKNNNAKLTGTQILDNIFSFLQWEQEGPLYKLVVKNDTINGNQYLIRSNYVNKGWKKPEAVKLGNSIMSVTIDVHVYYTIYSPANGIVSVNQVNQSPYSVGDTLLCINTAEDALLEMEKEEIATKIKERYRRKELEKVVRQEMIDSGELFGDAPKRPPVPREVVDAVYKRDGGRCVYCGSTENLQLDHIIPFSKGGSTTLENLQLLCQKCNIEKSNKIG